MSTRESQRSDGPSDPVGTRLPLVQVWSGLVFALFLMVHLANQAIAMLGPDAYDGTQRTLRQAYQWAPFELPLVIAPLLIHVAAALVRMLRRRRRKSPSPTSLSARLHRYSGIVMLVFFIGHVTATRGASFVYGVFPGFQGIAFTLRWVPAYFWPYYLLFGIAAVYHLVHGLGIALPVAGLGIGRVLRKPTVLVPFVLVGSLGIALGLLGFGGALYPVEHPDRGVYARLLVRLGIARSSESPATGR